MIERALRSAAAAIAVLAFIDPAVTLSGRARPRLAIVALDGPSMKLPDASGRTTRAAAAAGIVSRFRTDLQDHFDVVSGADSTANAMVIVGDRYPDEPISSAGSVSTVDVAGRTAPNVAVVRVDAPRAVPAATIVPLRIRVAASGVKGQTTVLTVRSGGADVGRATHTWSTDEEVWPASIDAVPVGSAPFVFAAAVNLLPTERTADDNHASIAVDATGRLRVLVVESRPSWATAFVRRALEDDGRFEVSGVSTAAPGAVVRSGASPSLPDDPRALDAIVAGGLDRASENELAFYERFARQRGGAVILVPDAAPSAALTHRLLPGVVLKETLLERPSRLVTTDAPAIDASEMLETIDLPPAADVIARAANTQRPIVWSVPTGDGRVVFSGAMDAWRYRAAPGTNASFDRFWRSVVASAALDAMPAIDVAVSPRTAAIGERVTVSARVRSIERNALGDALAIGARVGETPIRLWPDAAVGSFSGSFVVDSRHGRATQRIVASLADGISGSARLTIDESAREAIGVPMQWFSIARNGVHADSTNVQPVVDHIRRTTTAPPAERRHQPMRSAWWFAPFAMCLSAEWWLRRRRGAR